MKSLYTIIALLICSINLHAAEDQDRLKPKEPINILKYIGVIVKEKYSFFIDDDSLSVGNKDDIKIKTSFSSDYGGHVQLDTNDSDGIITVSFFADLNGKPAKDIYFMRNGVKKNYRLVASENGLILIEANPSGLP